MPGRDLLDGRKKQAEGHVLFMNFLHFRSAKCAVICNKLNELRFL